MSADPSEYLPRAGEFDPLADEVPAAIEPGAGTVPKREAGMIRFFKPSELASYEPPPNQNMLGDYHLQRGAPSVLAGPPGCGKSRAALWLGILGARGAGNWFGMQVHGHFRTLMLQNENGLARLHRDFAALKELDGLDDWLRISAPPACGLALQSPQFRNELMAMMRDFKPNLLIVDPWNACVRDQMEKDFQEGFTRLREVLAESPDEPACLILHHLRKPRSEDRHRGRGLANLLAGSYVLVSVARSVTVMQPAADDPEDSRVVITCAKNNDGELGPRTAWQRGKGMFEAVSNFDWQAFDDGAPKREAKVRDEHIHELFENGRSWLAIKEAASRLQEIAEVGRSAAYEALKLVGGRFSHLLKKEPKGGLISLVSGHLPAPRDAEAADNGEGAENDHAA